MPANRTCAMRYRPEMPPALTGDSGMRLLAPAIVFSAIAVGATAVAAVMMLASFALLLAINLLQRWTQRHHSA